MNYALTPTNANLAEPESFAGEPRMLSKSDLEAQETAACALIDLLERRYLGAFDPEMWDVSVPSVSDVPLLWRVTRLGRSNGAAHAFSSSAYMLSACHSPGLAYVSLLHGTGKQQELYVGTRRTRGLGSRSVQDFLEAQKCTLSAFYSGIEVEAQAKALCYEQMPGPFVCLETAPACAVITGIPSFRSGEEARQQSMEQFIDAMGGSQYALMVVAEPLAVDIVEESLTLCRRMLGEMQSFIRLGFNASENKTQGKSGNAEERSHDMFDYLPAGMFMLNQVLEFVNPALAKLTSAGFAMSTLASQRRSMGMHQRSTSESASRSTSFDHFNAHAEACTALLRRHIERLQQARCSGFWQTAVYVAAETDGALAAAVSACRSLFSGPTTVLDPLREVAVPPSAVRAAMKGGAILGLSTRASARSHPLGPFYDALATNISSEELSVLTSLPQRETAGLPMRDYARFSLCVPECGERGISLGLLQDHQGNATMEVRIPQDTLNRHLFVAGMTGYGKTNTCMQILSQGWELLGLPFLVIEPAKTEYRDLAALPSLRGKIRIYGVGCDAPLRINPLEVPRGVSLSRHIDLLKAVFNSSFPGMGHGLSFILEEALLEVYRDFGWSLSSSSNVGITANSSESEIAALMPNLTDLDRKIDVVLARRNYAGEVHRNLEAALHSRLRSLTAGTKGQVFHCRRSTPLEDLFGGPCVIELQNIGDDEEKSFIIALLFILLYEHAEVRTNSASFAGLGRLRHVTLIEEAHRLLQSTSHAGGDAGDPRGKAVSMFSDMLAEMRAYGEGFIIADQSPTKLVPEVLKNSSLKIIHRLAYPTDRDMASQCMNLTHEQNLYINQLGPGQAIVHDERFGSPALVSVYSAKPREKIPVVQPSAGQVEYLRRFGPCSGCLSPCEVFASLSDFGIFAAAAPGMKLLLDRASVPQGDPQPDSFAAWLEKMGLWVGKPLSTAESYCIAAEVVHQWLAERLGVTADALPVKRVRSLLEQERLGRSLGLCLKTLVHAPGDPVGLETLRSVFESSSAVCPCCGKRACSVRFLVGPYQSDVLKDLTRTLCKSTLPAEAKVEAAILAAREKFPYKHLQNWESLVKDWVLCGFHRVAIEQPMSAQLSDAIQRSLCTVSSISANS